MTAGRTRLIPPRRTRRQAGAFEAETLRILRALPGVRVVEATGLRGELVDAIVTVADRQVPIAVEAKSRVDAGAARLLIDRAAKPGGLPLLVVAGQSTHDARELLREHGIGIVDGNGNAHVELPGVVIHIHGAAQRNRKITTPTRLSGKAGIVAQALLLEPERAWNIAAVDDLAEATGAEPVTTGHNVVFLQVRDDSPPVLAQRVDNRRVVHRFRLYVDLLRDPQRGREQAQHLRGEAIGF